MAWEWSQQTGTYTDHALSRKLYKYSAEESVTMPFVRPVEGFGRRQGDTVTLTRIRQTSEPSSATLTEGERIPESDFAISTTSITVAEIGRSIPYTSLSDDLSFFDIENPIQMNLKDMMRLVLDTKAATAFQSGQIKYSVTGPASNSIATSGSFGTASTDNMSVWHLEQIHDYLYDTLRAPYWDGENYVGIFRQLGIRGIMSDPAWEEWHKYTNPGAKFNGEAGRMESIRLLRTNHNNAFGKVGTNSVLGEGVVFGQDAVAMAEVLTPELRAGIPADFGRSKAVAWYGILEFGPIWTTANAGEARIVHVGST